MESQVLRGLSPKQISWGMRNNPAFAKAYQDEQTQMQADAQGQQLAGASKGIRQFMEGREDAFNKAPSDVPYGMARPKYEQPSAMEDWRTRNQMMIESGNPAAQKQAYSERLEMMKRQTDIPKAKNLQTVMTGVKGDNRGRQQNILNPDGTLSPIGEAYSSQPQVQIGANGEQHRIGDIVPENEKARYGFRPEDTVIYGKDGPRILDTTSMSSDSVGKAAMTQTALEQIPVYREHLYSPSGEIDQNVIRAMSALNTFGDYAGPVIGTFSPELRDRAESSKTALMVGMMSITRTETGAAMADTEIEHTMERFWPKSTDSPSTQAQKLRAYEYFLTNVEEMLDPRSAQNRGLKPVEIANRAAKQALRTVKYSNVKSKGTKKISFEDIKGDLVKPGDTAQDDNYYYRVNPDGSRSRSPKKRNK